MLSINIHFTKLLTQHLYGHCTKALDLSVTVHLVVLEDLLDDGPLSAQKAPL